MVKVSFLSPLERCEREENPTGGEAARLNIVSPFSEVEHSNVTVVCSDTFFDLGIVENMIAA